MTHPDPLPYLSQHGPATGGQLWELSRGARDGAFPAVTDLLRDRSRDEPICPNAIPLASGRPQGQHDRVEVTLTSFAPPWDSSGCA
jgi:hypothetical protein